MMVKMKFKLVFAKFVLLALLAPGLFAAGSKKVMAIQPYGQVDERILNLLKEKIGFFYSCEVVVLPPEDMPEDLYYPAGNRYDASRLIRRMKSEYSGKYFKTLGITGLDVYHEKADNPYYGVVGLGLVGGKTAIVSTFRLKKAGGDKKEKLEERVVKSSIHEIGHLLGLKHCDKTSYCIMQSARGSVLVIDKKELRFCPSCLNQLEKLK